MYYFVLVCVLSLVCSASTKVKSKTIRVENIQDDAQGYFWRDYDGVLPEDAFPGGLDSDGNTIYIAQVLRGGFLIPGQMNQTDNKAYYDFWHKETTATENIKILCTRYPKHFKWIKTTDYLFDNLDRKRLISGGFQPKFETYIGRLISEAETSVGKVIIGEGKKELHITKNGKAISYNSFEVLSHDPDAPTYRKKISYSITTPTPTDGDNPEVSQANSDLECAKQIIKIIIP